MSDPRIPVLIADDEPLARATLRALVEEDPELQVVAECRDGDEAFETLARGGVTLAVLDVEMPGRTGLEVVRDLGDQAPPVVVFATAHPQFAVAAFEVRAVDYVLKPFDQERFAEAIQRAKERVRTLDALAPLGARIVIHKEGRVELVRVDRLVWIEAADQYVRLHTDDGEVLMRESMGHIEEELDASRFLRVHRSAIVALDRVVRLQSSRGGGATLVLSDGSEVPVSRSRAAEVRRRLG